MRLYEGSPKQVSAFYLPVHFFTWGSVETSAPLYPNVRSNAEHSRILSAFPNFACSLGLTP